MARLTRPGRARRFNPSSLPSPGAAAKTSVKFFGAPVSAKRCSSAAIKAAGVPLPTKPEQATVSPSRMIATASAALTILFFISARRNEIAHDRDLLGDHQRRRVTASFPLHRAHLARERRCAASTHLRERLRREEIGLRATNDEHWAIDLVPQVPQHHVESDRQR